MRSAMAGSSSCNSSGHHGEEIQSNRSSLSDDYSQQSDMSLCDDGGSEMEEGDHDGNQIVLGHLASECRAHRNHQMQSGDNNCYEEDCEEGAAYSSLLL